MEDLNALREIASKQQEALKIIRENGFIFKRENLGKEPGNWSHLAFTLYSMICEIDTIARNALDQEPEPCSQCGRAGKWLRDEDGLSWWYCNRCRLDFSTIQQR